MPRVTRRTLRSPLFALAVLFAFALAPATASALTGNGKLQIHHIDVGQGDGMVLISPNGQVVMFDDGTYTNCPPVVAYVQGLGVTSMDYHFLSHYHADHLGCITEINAGGIPVNVAGYDRGYSYSSASYTDYVNALGAKRTTVAKGQTFTLDAGSPNPVTITCVDLNGAGVYSVNGSDENSKSAVYKVSYGAFDEIIGGDLTGSVANGNDVETTVGPEVGDVEIYKVHHHGSRYSSNDNWLNAVTAEVGIIQCGDGNTYGHPTVDALTRMHNHGIKTYWIETGAGATPDPQWDKVANGPVIVEVDLTAGNYTVSGNGFADTYTIGGGGGPVLLDDTQVASSVAMLNGTITSGSVANLAVADNSRMTVTAARVGSYWTEWYGEVVLAHPPVNMTVSYEGSYSLNRTQTLFVWNWSTGAWEQVDQATVGTTDIARSWTTPTPGAYVSPAGVVRCRVLASNRNKSYSCRADYMAVAYQYESGSAITVTPAQYAALVPPDFHEPYRNAQPQAMVRRLTAAGAADGITLEWGTGIKEHVDGFNVYRQSANGERVWVGYEALLATTSDEAIFTYVDHEAPAGASTYWLGARSCAGPEGLIGPIEASRFATSPAAVALALAASPNPTTSAVRFTLRLPEAGAVELAIFDLSGRRIATPLRGAAFAGETSLEWNLSGEGGARVGPGLYFAKLTALGRTTVTRLSVLP